MPSEPTGSSVDFEKVDSHYFQQRELKKGAAGWVLLVGLGVAYVISGDYAGWNFGLAQGGWGGMFLATLLMATMYLCMCFSLAELSSMIPTAGGGYGFARSAFGPWGGFLTGTAILIEYAIAPAAIAGKPAPTFDITRNCYLVRHTDAESKTIRMEGTSHA